MSESNKTLKPKSRLGRGLSSLMSMAPPPEEAAAPEGKGPVMREIPAPPGESPTPPGIRVLDLPLASIVPNPHQPRRQFDEASLAELASSLKSTGVIQPIIVRPTGKGDGSYQLIAGERRWRAAKLADLPTVPSI